MMFILLLSTLPCAALDQPSNRVGMHTHRPKLGVAIRRIVIAIVARAFHAIGLDR